MPSAPGIPHSARIHAVVAGASLAIMGCSLPVGPRGATISTGYARVSAETNQVETVVPGLDVRIGTGHDGLSLGWSTLLLVAPTASGSHPPAATTTSWTFGWPLSVQRTDPRGTHRLGCFYWNRPSLPATDCRMVSASHVGIAAPMNRQIHGFEVGYGSQQWTVIPTNRTGAWQTFYLGGLLPEARIESLQHDTIQPP